MENVELTAQIEMQESRITMLETLLQKATSEKCVLNKILCMQLAMNEAGTRHQAIPELQDSCRKKQEEVETLQEELQAEQLQQETVASEHKSEMTGMLAELESEKNKSCDIDSPLQREEQTACELLESIQDNSSVLLEGTGRRQSRRLRNSTATKKPRLAEPSTSKEEDEDEGSKDSESDKPRSKKSKMAKGGRGRPKKAQPVTSTSVPITKPKGKPTDSIVSCEATSTTGAPTLPTPTEEFTSGAFVVSKTDFQNGGDPPIW